jgi:hypothetical protein
LSQGSKRQGGLSVVDDRVVSGKVRAQEQQFDKGTFVERCIPMAYQAKVHQVSNTVVPMAMTPSGLPFLEEATQNRQ